MAEKPTTRLAAIPFMVHFVMCDTIKNTISLTNYSSALK
jgi:hypothetical protein